MTPGARRSGGGWRRTVQRLGRRVLNPPAVALLRRGLPWPPYTPATALVLEHIGRRTGRRLLTPMGYVREPDGSVLAVAEHGRRADWVGNALAAPSVAVWIGRRRHTATVTVLDDADPSAVLARMGRVHRAAVRTLAAGPAVVRFELHG